MGHEVIVFGSITGADPDRLHERNAAALAAALAALPVEDEWPSLVRGMFSLPEQWPLGTYRARVIHFGASLKDEPQDRAVWEQWLGKFEAVLRRLYWWSAHLHLHTEFEPDQVYRWLPTPAAIDRAVGDPPRPIDEWERAVSVLPAWTAEPGAAPDPART